MSSHERHALTDGWQYCSTAPGAIEDPRALDTSDLAWHSAIVPGTVATSERHRAGAGFDLEKVADYDAFDWWYRCVFDATEPTSNAATSVLCLDGLATIADVWVNGHHVLSSNNMFVGHEVDVTSLIAPTNTLVIRFRSLRKALDARRPRPRWRTKLVEHQQLRWHRTTLLGRMPGWSPPVRAVGPWRSVRIERRSAVDVVSGEIRTTLAKGGGQVDVALELRAIGGAVIRGATLDVDGQRTALDITGGEPGSVVATGRLLMANVQPWWPHTHGAQPRYDARVVVDVGDRSIDLDLGRIAFRHIDLDRSDDGFALLVNGATIFCRGACWTTPDIVSLAASTDGYRRLLTLARDAGMNMIRIGGTMVYEDDAFYDLCDELGILVWQDFMFANMDYPVVDSAFSENVNAEIEHELARLRRHPCLAVLCGNSEIEQQAAMLGLDREQWSNRLFQDTLPHACTEQVPGVPYWPSSPAGGAMPFHVNVGVGHYYGVGAYLRPLEDARRSRVRFTSECLGFSNVPSPAVVDRLLPNGEAAFHHPRWKARVPRDHGTGWDFEDVRDHYLRLLFGVDPMLLRYAEMDRYLALSRVVTGEVMARTIGEWRRADSTCRGALVWFYQDLWTGAGWGVVDASGEPKAAYYALKRAMQPISIAITDEGVNGLHIHVTNDGDTPLRGQVRIALLRSGATVVAEVTRPIDVGARSATYLMADELLGHFRDPAYAYRFGPPGHDVVAATLVDDSDAVVCEAFHFPLGLSNSRTDAALISGEATAIDDTTVAITLRAERFAQSIALDGGEYTPDDNYFHMAPGTERRILARARTAGARFDGFAQPLNAYEGVRIALSRAARPAEIAV